jgi:putative tryptophan/tyrosine transport system substrate-binding protein
MIARRGFIAGLAAAAAWPLAARAQQPYRIGYLALMSGEERTLMKPLLERLRELGYGEGGNLTLTYRSAEGRPERLAQLAAELVRANPDVLIAGFGTLAAQAAKSATTTVPIVMTSVGDPVGAGVIASLSRPGGNVTGLSDQARDLASKRLEFLNDVIPGKRRVAVLMNPDTPFTALAFRELRAAAETVPQSLEVFEARTADRVGASVEAASKAGAAGLFIIDDPLILSLSQQISALAIKLRLPTISAIRDFVEVGGLLSYGVDRRQLSRRAADYVDRILKGERPADLPVEQPTRFELVINLGTAKAIGLTIPETFLVRADEVIE